MALRFRANGDRYLVLADDAVIGTVWKFSGRHQGIGRARLAPDRPYFDTPASSLWKCDPEGAMIDAHDADLIRRHIDRDKTTRKTAAALLLGAYETAGVALPEQLDEQS